MILQEFIKKIADTLKVDADLLAKELKKEDDISLELPTLKFYDNEEYKTLKINLGKIGYEDGKKAGIEMNAKKLKEITGVEVDGKDLNKIIEAYKIKINKDAKIEPNDKIKELQQTISILQKTVTESELTYEKLKHENSKQKLEHKILGLIPKNNIGLNNKVVLSDMRANGYDISEVEGVLQTSKDGKVLKCDKLQNPLNFIDVSTQYLKEKKWVENEKNGRGEFMDVNNSSKTNYEEFIKQCEKEGINPSSAEAMAKAKQISDNNPEFYN